MKVRLPKEVTVTGVLYVSWAGFTAIQTWWSNDDVYKYVSPVVVFWVRGGCGVVAAMAGALKMYMSTEWGKRQVRSEGEAPEVKTGTVRTP